jgi:hypothetical protein
LQTFDTAPNCPSLNEIARAVVSAWQHFSGVLATSSALPMSTHFSLSVMAFSHTVFLFQTRRRLVYIIVSAAMLRRTSRSLMSRAGVDADIAERCLGHVIPGVRGVYDRHEYYREKAQAYEALAGLIDRIVKGTGAKVVSIGERR